MSPRPASSDQPSRGRRGAVATFINHHRVLWDMSMGFIGLVVFVLGFVLGEEHPVYASLCLVAVLIFIAEFSLRLWAAHDRRHHLRTNWLHAVLILPLVGSLKVFAGLRSIRVLNLAKTIGHVGHVVFHNVHAFFSRQGAAAAEAAVETSQAMETSRS